MWVKKLLDGFGLKLDEKPKLPPPRRSTRTKIPNKRYESIFFFTLMSILVDYEPKTFDEASCYKQWVESMQEECESIVKNHVLDLVPLPEGKTIIGCLDIQVKA